MMQCSAAIRVGSLEWEVINQLLQYLDIAAVRSNLQTTRLESQFVSFVHHA